MKELLKQLVNQFSNNESYYNNPAYNEQECRLEFIDKLLQSFGWDVKNDKHLSPLKKEVFVEKYESNMKRPDYSLTFHGYTKFFVEAKKPSVDLNGDVNPSIQARKYGWNAKHPVVVLTNFKDLFIYDSSVCPKNDDGINTALIKKYHFTEYLDKYDEIISFIGRETVYSGEFDRKNTTNSFSTSHDSIKVDDAFLNDINKWRIELACNLYNTGDDKYKDLKYLNDSIQHFLNKIIFLRICEDRNLDTYQTLIDSIKNQSILKEELNKLFRKSDAKYNSGLFSDPVIVFDLDNDVISDIVKHLYYPDCPYLFNIIEPNLLGNIYELFLVEKLSLDCDGNICLAKKNAAADKSVVTTPVEIVKSIVASSVEPLVKNKTLDEIYNINVVDIACGSGIFLEEAFAVLCDSALAWCEQNDNQKIEFTSNGDKKLTFDIKRKILVNCVFGVDIDSQAVEVCKFSLLIKLLESENNLTLNNYLPILPSLDHNIYCGNSLVERRDLPQSCDIDMLLAINPFNWNGINRGNKFDCIIGNPPYVKTEDMHATLLPAEFDIYTRKNKTASKQFDKYYLFIEQAKTILKENGIFGMIIPNKFMKIDNAKNLRHLLRKNDGEITIIDFGDAQLFEDKTIYSCLLTFKSVGDGLIHYKHCESLPSLITNSFGSESEEIIDSIGDDVWAFSEKYNNTFNDAFEDLTRLFDVLNGIQTSMENPHVYWIGDNQITREDSSLLYFTFNDHDYCVEKAILRPYFKPINNDEKGGGSFDLIATNKQIIYPYDDEGRLYSSETMATQYPNCWAYLNAHYDILVPKQVSPNGRRDIPNATPETWYQYGRTQNLTAFNNAKKIIVRNMFNKPMFAIDDSNMILSSGGTAGYSAIKRKDNSVYSLEFIQAWLNADYTVEILKDIASQFEGGFYAIGTSKLKKIRIPHLDFNNVDDVAFYNGINRNVNEINILMRKLKTLSRQHEIDLIKEENEKLIKEINEWISKYYNEHKN